MAYSATGHVNQLTGLREAEGLEASANRESPWACRSLLHASIALVRKDDNGQTCIDPGISASPSHSPKLLWAQGF